MLNHFMINTDRKITFELDGRNYRSDSTINLKFECAAENSPILRSLKLSYISKLAVPVEPAPYIEELVLDNVRWGEDTEQFYQSIAVSFPNLKVLTINESGLTKLPELPVNLVILDCMNNRIQELAGLPDTLLEVYADRNNLKTLPKHLPKKLTHLTVARNYFDSGTVISKDLMHLRADYSSHLSITGNINNWRIGRYIGGVMDISGEVRRLVSEGGVIQQIHKLPENLSTLFILRQDREEFKERVIDLDLSYLTKLKKFICHRDNVTYQVPESCQVLGSGVKK